MKTENRLGIRLQLKLGGVNLSSLTGHDGKGSRFAKATQDRPGVALSSYAG